MKEQTKTGEVENKETTATVKLEDVLGNKEIMEGIMKSDVITKFIQGEVDKARTKASIDKQTEINKVKQESETEFSKYKAETDKKIAELEAFQRNHFRTEALKKLGLEVELWDYVKGDTEEEIKQSAEALKKIINKKAETAVGGNIKPTINYTGLTAEKFGKMTYAEKAELYQKDQELYNKLSKGE
ncbi:MAG: hypothetical protein CR959_00300 [Fusobacteriales bacterium]|nr:MAG: hypothetical protein CR959_00300 [Fusobacteriales bacterium]